jgi:hypothetical protein
LLWLFSAQKTIFIVKYVKDVVIVKYVKDVVIVSAQETSSSDWDVEERNWTMSARARQGNQRKSRTEVN